MLEYMTLVLTGFNVIEIFFTWHYKQLINTSSQSSNVFFRLLKGIETGLEEIMLILNGVMDCIYLFQCTVLCIVPLPLEKIVD